MEDELKGLLQELVGQIEELKIAVQDNSASIRGIKAILKKGIPIRIVESGHLAEMNHNLEYISKYLEIMSR